TTANRVLRNGGTGKHRNAIVARQVRFAPRPPRPVVFQGSRMNKPEAMPLHASTAVPAGGARVAVLVPCFNEAAAVATVVADFRAVLPAAQIYVYDNNSTDRTAEVARTAGAEVRRETYQGKGHVVRRMFADVDADIY